MKKSMLFAAVAAAFGEPQLVPALRLFALDVPLFTIAQTYRSIQVGLGRFSRRALAAAVRTAARLIIEPQVPGFAGLFMPPAAIDQLVRDCYLANHRRYIESKAAMAEYLA